MLQLLRFIYLLNIAIIFIALNCNAAIYKTTDKHGNITFSDTPSAGATVIYLQKKQDVTWRNFPKVKLSTNNTKKTTTQVVTKPAQLIITSPTKNQYIRSNQGALIVTVTLNIALQPGFKLQPLLDNEPYGKPQTTLKFELSGIYRGVHKLQIQLLDASGKELARSNAVSFYMARTIAKKRQIIDSSKYDVLFVRK